MAYFNEWITTLIIFILLAIILELLLPTSSMKRYADLVLGLIMMILILQPLFDLLQKDPSDWLDLEGFDLSEGAEEVEVSINEKKREIQAAHDAYISEQVGDELNDKADDMLEEEFELAIVSLAVIPDSDDESARISVSLQNANKEGASGDIETVEAVVLDERDQKEELRPYQEMQLGEVRKRLAEVWEMAETDIDVSLEEERLNE